jgi:hypothetical protein
MSKLPLKLQLQCWKSAGMFFAMYSNPKNRGPNFTWENLSKTISNLATLNINPPEKHKKEVKKEVERILSFLVEEATD